MCGFWTKERVEWDDEPLSAIGLTTDSDNALFINFRKWQPNPTSKMDFDRNQVTNIPLGNHPIF
jgi:hypothetical protein